MRRSPAGLDQSLSCRFWKVATHPFKPLSVLPRQRRKTKRQPVSRPRQAWRQRTGVAGGLRIRRYLPEAVIVLGALYCAGLPRYGVTTISFTGALYIALAVVLALALMLPRPARTHLALVLASFGTALLLAEVYFSATDRSTLEIQAEFGIGDQAEFGTRSRPDCRPQV